MSFLGPPRIERIVTSGPYELDGQQIELENNVWLIGDDDEVLVVDAPHDVQAIAAAVGGRRTIGIVCTHAHRDHVEFACVLGTRLGAPVWLHAGDDELWATVHESDRPDGALHEGQVVTVAGSDVHVLHTPGHTPGSVSLYLPDLEVVLTGDTLFPGGPGATGRPFSDFGAIITSVRDRLLTLPEQTRVLPGHGDETTVGTEAPHLAEWVARGH